MSTNARIGIQNEDGTVTSIYMHWDGYPEHHEPILTKHYTTEEAVRELIALGDLSVLAEELGEKRDFQEGVDDNPTWCLAYERDRGETDVKPITHPADKWPNYGQEYTYLFANGSWSTAKTW